MSVNDREDALARALDLLAESDPARSDPRLLRDPELAAEARAARETAADVWLAVSPLRAAPPEILPEILERIPLPTGNVVVHRRPSFVAAGGWAAAAAVALAWLLSPEPEVSPPSITEAPPAGRLAADSENPPPAPGPVRPRTAADRDRLHDELTRLRRSLADERNLNKAAENRPRIVELRPPGSPRANPDEARDRLLAALANALRGMLEEEANDPAALVIERGWLPQGEARLAADEQVRHRNFPAETWNEYGLLRSEDGRFYDPAALLIWEKDPASTDYLGRRATADDDLAAFQPEEAPQRQEAEVYVQSTPAGYLVEDPASGDAQLVVSGLPPLPDGGQYVLIGATSQGQPQSYFINNSTGTSSLLLPGGISDFSVVRTNPDGSSEVVLTGGN